MRRLLIAGSRKCWTSPHSIDNAFKTLTGDIGDEPFTVVTGGANGAIFDEKSILGWLGISIRIFENSV